MKEQTKTLLKNQYEKLPDGLKRALTHANLPIQIQNIIKKHSLRLDQGGIVEDQAMLVLLGLEHPDNFVTNLVRSLAFPLEKVVPIAQDVNAEIFQSIRELLIHTYENPKTVPSESSAISETKTEPAPAAPTTLSTPQPTPVIPVTNDIARTKLEQSFRVPPQAATVMLNQTPAAASISKPIQRREIDPYREPIS